MALQPSRARSFGAHLLDRPDSRTQQLLLGLGLALVGSLLIALSARVQVPFYPVPMTMQTFAVTLIGASFGARLGGATMLLYLAEGAVGLPVFANTPERGLGLAYMLGPTGGYLVGFALCAVVLGWAVDRGWGRGLLRLTALMAGAMLLPYAFGAAWLAQFTGIEGALASGVVPFLLGDAAKVALAAACVRLGQRSLQGGDG
jgi:biotin transport system substrate-specific component